MLSHQVRPLVVRGDAPGEPCVHCDVRHRSVCAAIDDPHIERLAAIADTVELARGATFIQEGDPATDFFNVTAGTIKLYKLLADGRQQITGFAGVGYFLGLAASRAYAFSAEAVEPSRLCRFSRRKLERLMAEFPDLEHRLLETACNELAVAQERMLLLGRRSAAERVAAFLLARMGEAAPCGHGESIRLPMTRAEVADFLGLTIETVSRNLSRFKADRRIAIPVPDTIVVLDRPWLEAIADPG